MQPVLDFAAVDLCATHDKPMFTDAAGLALAVRQMRFQLLRRMRFQLLRRMRFQLLRRMRFQLLRRMRFQLLRRDVKVGIQQLSEKLMRF